MREILYRGKRVDNGKWITGLLAQYLEGIKATICRYHYVPCDTGLFICIKPDTVGQYTGMSDVNGEKIFEGDIVQIKKYGMKYNFCMDFINGRYLIYNRKNSFELNEDMSLEIIGNIYDTPELLES